MKAREFWILFAPSFLVMGGLLVIPLFRTIQWSFEERPLRHAGHVRRVSTTSPTRSPTRDSAEAALFTVIVTVITTAILLVLGYIVATGIEPSDADRARSCSASCSSRTCCRTWSGAVAFSWLVDDNFGGIRQPLHRTDHRHSGAVVHRAGAQRDPHHRQHRVAHAAVRDAHHPGRAPGCARELREAATIDGACPLQTHLHVIIPTIRGVLGFVTLISIMDVLRMFDNLIPLSPQAAAIGNESIMLYVYSSPSRTAPAAGARQRDQRAD